MPDCSAICTSTKPRGQGCTHSDWRSRLRWNARAWFVTTQCAEVTRRRHAESKRKQSSSSGAPVTESVPTITSSSSQWSESATLSLLVSHQQRVSQVCRVSPRKRTFLRQRSCEPRRSYGRFRQLEKCCHHWRQRRGIIVSIELYGGAPVATPTVATPAGDPAPWPPLPVTQIGGNCTRVPRPRAKLHRPQRSLAECHGAEHLENIQTNDAHAVRGYAHCHISLVRHRAG